MKNCVNPPMENGLTKLCETGHLDRALDVLLRVEQLGVPASINAYFCFLRACHKRKALNHAIQINSHLAKQHPGFLSGFLGDYLVITLAKCGGLTEAHQLFRLLPQRNVYSWTAIISGCVETGQYREALDLHQCMQKDGVEGNRCTLNSLLKACGRIPDLVEGRRLHELAKKMGFATDAYVANSLIGMYGKCGNIREAEVVFQNMPDHGIVSWNVLLNVYVEREHLVNALRLYRQMCEDGMSPDGRTFVTILKACNPTSSKDEGTSLHSKSPKSMYLEIVRGFHADIRRQGLTSNLFVGNTLLIMYAKCGDIQSAEAIFSELSKSVVETWNAMLSAYVEQGDGEKAVQLYDQMQINNIKPDQRTFVSVLQACISLIDKDEDNDKTSLRDASLKIGQALHLDIFQNGYDSESFIASSLIGFYGKCGKIAEAETVFCKLLQRNRVVWCAMLSAYVEQDCGDKALQLSPMMQREGISMDQVAFLILLQACCLLADKEEGVIVEDASFKLVSFNIGQALHDDAKEHGHELDVSVGTVLLSLYAKCGFIAEAENVFNKLSKRDLVCWTAMLLAYVEQDQSEKALELYSAICNQQVIMDDIMLVCLLQACTECGSADTFWNLYFLIVSSGYDHLPFIASSLIEACSSGAEMKDADAVFNGLWKPDIISWSSCLSGYSHEGNQVACMMVLEEMQAAGIEIDEVILLSFLSALSHGGLVQKGIEFFEFICRTCRFRLEMKHYATMADLLGRVGDFKRLENMLLKMMTQPDLSIWLCVLGACCTHGNIELGKLAFDQAVHLQPKSTTAYVLLSNLYADAGFPMSAKELIQCRQNFLIRSSVRKG